MKRLATLVIASTALLCTAAGFQSNHLAAVMVMRKARAMGWLVRKQRSNSCHEHCGHDGDRR